REIFELYKGGLGGNRLSKKLNKKEMYTKEGNPWSDNTIMKVIRNPVYYGSFRWLDEIIDNTHEAIIPKEEWDEVQSIIDDRRSRSPRSVSSNYIFSGKLKCNNCGSVLTGYYTSYKKANGEVIKYPNYRCISKRQ